MQEAMNEVSIEVEIGKYIENHPLFRQHVYLAMDGYKHGKRFASLAEVVKTSVFWERFEALVAQMEAIAPTDKTVSPTACKHCHEEKPLLIIDQFCGAPCAGTYLAKTYPVFEDYAKEFHKIVVRHGDGVAMEVMRHNANGKRYSSVGMFPILF